jgi:hypothetical protein
MRGLPRWSMLHLAQAIMIACESFALYGADAPERRPPQTPAFGCLKRSLEGQNCCGDDSQDSTRGGLGVCLSHLGVSRVTAAEGLGIWGGAPAYDLALARTLLPLSPRREG